MDSHASTVSLAPDPNVILPEFVPQFKVTRQKPPGQIIKLSGVNRKTQVLQNSFSLHRRFKVFNLEVRFLKRHFNFNRLVSCFGILLEKLLQC